MQYKCNRSVIPSNTVKKIHHNTGKYSRIQSNTIKYTQTPQRTITYKRIRRKTLGSQRASSSPRREEGRSPAHINPLPIYLWWSIYPYAVIVSFQVSCAEITRVLDSRGVTWLGGTGVGRLSPRTILGIKIRGSGIFFLFIFRGTWLPYKAGGLEGEPPPWGPYFNRRCRSVHFISFWLWLRMLSAGTCWLHRFVKRMMITLFLKRYFRAVLQRILL